MSVRSLPGLRLPTQAPALVQQASFGAASGSPTLTLSLGAAPKVGNVLIGMFGADHNTTISSRADILAISQTGVVWRPCCGFRRSGNDTAAIIWTGRINSASAGTSITVTYGGQWPDFWVGEFTNLAGFLVRSFMNSAASTTLTITTDSQSGEGRYAIGSLLAGAWSWDSGGAGPSSFTAGWTTYAIGDTMFAWRLMDPSGAVVTGQATNSRSAACAGVLGAFI